MQLFLRVFPLAASTVPQCIGQREVFVKRGITKRSTRGALVQRLKRNATLLSLCERPHRRRVAVLCDRAAEWFRRVRSRDAAGKLTMFGGESVFQPVYKEFFEGSKIRPIAQFWSMEKMGEPGSLYRRVYLGGTHTQLSGQFGVRGPPGVRRNDLQGNVNVLWL
jgi:hypothetical protein